MTTAPAHQLNSEARQKVGLALWIGAAVGALVGLIEAIGFLRQVDWWWAEAETLALAMLVYGGVNATLTGLWGWLALRLDLRSFPVRTLLFSGLTMLYLVGGFYINLWWFPRLLSLPSLAFTGCWTLAWIGAGVWLLKARRLQTDIPIRTWRRGLSVGLAVLGVVAALSCLPAVVGTRSDLAAPPGAVPAGPKRPNVLLIVLDTTRADHLSCYGYGRDTTPNLDRLAEEGALFESATSAAPWTLPSHASLFTGLYPSQHGTEWSHQRLDDQLTTLAEVLRESGYQTAGFSNNGWVSQAMNFDQGFESFADFKGWWRIGWAVNRLAAIRMLDKGRKLLIRRRDAGAARTNRHIARWFERSYDARRPFLIFINYLEPHFVYDPPEPYRGRFLRAENRLGARRLDLTTVRFSAPPVRFDPATEAVLTDLYDGEIAYLDAKVGELLDDLRRRGLLDETIVIVTSDHGESLGDHEIFQHQFCVYETLVHVPLIVRYPAAFPVGTRVAEPVSLVDVMPTLISLLDLAVPAEVARALRGRPWVGSPLAVASDRMLLAEYEAPAHKLPLYQRQNSRALDEGYFTRDLKTVRTGAMKFIWASDGQHELYDLARDPEETLNLLGHDPAQARVMEAALREQVAALERVGSPEGVQPMDEATREELRALGYLQ